MSIQTGVDPNHIAGSNFIMVHLDLVDDLGGDFHAALLLDRIRFRAGDGWWTATREQVATDTRLNEYHLKRALNVLREHGFVETERVSAYDATLRYRVVMAEKTATTEKAHSAVSTSRITPPEMENSATSEMAYSAVSTVTKNSEEQKQEPPYSPPDPFDEFWKAYPRKKGKGQAERAWRAAVKKTDPALLIAAAVRFRQQVEGEDLNFVKHPATWLNGQCWLDEPDPEPMTNMQAHMALIRETAYNEGYEIGPGQLEIGGPSWT